MLNRKKIVIEKEKGKRDIKHTQKKGKQVEHIEREKAERERNTHTHSHAETDKETYAANIETSRDKTTQIN